MKIMFINPENQEEKVINCEKSHVEVIAHQLVSKFLNNLVCRIGNSKTKFFIYCSDGNFTNTPDLVSATSMNGEPILYGKLLICKLGLDGVVSLTDNEIDYIKSFLSTEFVIIDVHEFSVEHTLMITNVTETTI